MSDSDGSVPQVKTSTSSIEITLGNVSDPELPEVDVLSELESHPYMNPDLPLLELIRNTEYLQRYPSWLAFCGPENKKTFSPTYVARNDTIWELIFTERGFMDMLLMVRDLYMIPFPEFEPGQFGSRPDGMSSATLREALFPGLEQLIAAHERILRPLLALHDRATDHVVNTLGSVLVKLFDKDTQNSLSELYGGFMFAQKRIRQQLQICRNWPPVAQFFEKCRQDPRSARRSLEDCHMVIVQRWTKVETLLDVIIRNTLNHPSESENLETVRNAVRSLLKGAESVMTAREHADKLREFAEQLTVSSSIEGSVDERRLLDVMRLPSTRLLNYGPLRIAPYAAGQQATSAPVEVTGVALDTCFFVLQKGDSGGYYLFRGTKMPPILWWGQVYGYFRPSLEKNGFFLILHPESVLTSFVCSTVDELVRWEKIMNDGFSQWRESAPVSMESLNLELEQARSLIQQQWDRTEAILNLLNELDADLERAWAARTFVSLVLIDERLSSARMKLPTSDSNKSAPARGTARLTLSDARSRISTETSSRMPKVESPPSTSDVLDSQTFLHGRNNVSDLNQMLSRFQQILVRLQFSLVGSASGGLTRSASDVEEPKRPSSKPVRKNETFSVRDYTSSSGDSTVVFDVRRKSQAKKYDAYRLSTTMVSLFRGSNRDKTASGSSLQNPSDQTPSSVSQSKSSPTYPSNTCQNAAGSNLIRHSSISNTSPLPSFPPLPSVMVNENGYLPQSETNSLSVARSLSGSSSSLLNLASVDALRLLKDLTSIAEEFFPMVFKLRTRNDEVEASNLRLKAEKEKLDSVVTRAKQSGFIESTCSRCGGSTGVESDGSSAFSIKQGTEKLRRDVESFRKKSEEWDKEYKRRRDSLERGQTKLGEAWKRYEEACALLERKQRQYEEDRKTLQRLIDLHATRGVNFSGITMPEINLPSPTTTGSHSPVRTGVRSNASCVADLNLIDPRQSRHPDVSSTHSQRSTNDDLRGSRTSPHLTMTDSRVPDPTVMHDDVSIHRQPLTSSGSIKNDDLPMHLRGSLLNQPGRARDSSGFGMQSRSPVSGSLGKSSSFTTDNPNNPNSALWKLADSSKTHSTTKSTKSSFFRRP